MIPSLATAVFLACNTPGPMVAFDGHPTRWCGIDKKGRLRCYGAEPDQCSEPDRNETGRRFAARITVPVYLQDLGETFREELGGELETSAYEDPDDYPHWPDEGVRYVVETNDGLVWSWDPRCDETVGLVGLDVASDSSTGYYHFVLSDRGKLETAYEHCLRRWADSTIALVNEGYDEGEAGDRSFYFTARSLCVIEQDESLTCKGYVESAHYHIVELYEHTQSFEDTLYYPDGQPNRPGPWTDAAPGFFWSCALDEDGKTTCWMPEDPVEQNVDWMNLPDMTPPDTTFIDIQSGPYHACGEAEDGSIECWGSDAGMATMGGPGPYIDWNPWCGLTEDGRLDCWTKAEVATERCEMRCDEEGCE